MKTIRKEYTIEKPVFSVSKHLTATSPGHYTGVHMDEDGLVTIHAESRFGQTKNPFESLSIAATTWSGDWSSDKRLYWIYCIITGPPDKEAYPDEHEEAVNMFGGQRQMDRLLEMHGKFKEAWKMFQPELEILESQP